MAFSRFNTVKLSAIAAVVPENYINIDDEAYYYDNPKKFERNKKILGLGKRHIIEEGVGGLDLAECAVHKLVEKCGVDLSDIDALVYASSGHDYPYPASSCIMQGRLNLPEHVSCFDFSGLACSGYIYHLWVLSSMIESGAIRKCLYIAADIGSTHTNNENRNVCILFGDGAVAAILESTDTPHPSYFLTGTNGKDWDKIVAPFGGYKLPIRNDIANLEVKDSQGNVWHLWEDILKGFEVFKYTSIIGPQGIKQILEYADKREDDIDFFAVHQANKQIVETIARHANLPKDKYSSETFTKYANTGVTSVAMNVCDSLFEKQANEILLASFGIGLSYSFGIINFSHTKNAGVSFYKKSNSILSREEQIAYWINYYKENL